MNSLLYLTLSDVKMYSVLIDHKQAQTRKAHGEHRLLCLQTTDPIEMPGGVTDHHQNFNHPCSDTHTLPENFIQIGAVFLESC